MYFISIPFTCPCLITTWRVVPNFLLLIISIKTPLLLLLIWWEFLFLSLLIESLRCNIFSSSSFSFSFSLFWYARTSVIMVSRRIFKFVPILAEIGTKIAFSNIMYSFKSSWTSEILQKLRKKRNNIKFRRR